MQTYSKSVKLTGKALQASNNLPKHNEPSFLSECAEMIPKNNEVITINQEKEDFLRYFIQGSETRNNRAQSYILARGLKPDEWDRTPQKRTITDRMGKTREEDIPNSSEFDRKMNTARVTAYGWLCQPRVNARRMQLTSELLKDHIVDNEMMKVIIQDKDLTAKNTAMREYNKLAQRIVDRKDIRTQSVGVVRHLYGEADKFGFEEDV